MNIYAVESRLPPPRNRPSYRPLPPFPVRADYAGRVILIFLCAAAGEYRDFL